MEYKDYVDREVNKIQDLLNCSREDPDKLHKIVDKKIWDTYQKYCKARDNDEDGAACLYANAIRCSKYWILLDIYEEKREERRKEFNNNKPTLVDIFYMWTRKEINNKEARRLRDQIRLFVSPKYDYTSFFRPDRNEILSVGDNNSWHDLMYSIGNNKEFVKLAESFRKLINAKILTKEEIEKIREKKEKEKEIKQINEMVEFSIANPDKDNPYVSDEVNELYRDYKEARAEGDGDLADFYASDILSTPYKSILCANFRLEQDARLKHNEGKIPLTVIFEEWVTRKMTADRAKELYKELDIFLPFEDEAKKKFELLNRLYYYQSGNSWEEVFEIARRYVNSKDLLEEFKRLVGCDDSNWHIYYSERYLDKIM